MRQAHVMPALQDGLGAHLIAGDIRSDPRTGVPESFAAFHEVVPDGINVKRAVFANPINSDRICVLRRFHAYMAEDFAAATAAALADYSIVYDLVGLGATVLGNVQPGQRLVTGYQQTGGVSPPPLTGSDIQFPPKNSVCGWKAVDPNGISGAYIWRGIIGQHGGFDTLEEFLDTRGPRMIVFPGGIFESYLLETSAHMYFNMWWDEYPLT
jgi:hypothetical protein